MDIKYYPCRADSHGKIRVKLTKYPMSKADAEAFLKTKYPRMWLNCEAIPQPETMNNYLINFERV